MSHSKWHQLKKYDVKNSLVAILGIGEYNENMDDLVGVKTDYKNLIEVFYKQFGYTLAFYDDTNKLQYCNKKPNYMINTSHNSNINATKPEKFDVKSKNGQFKLHWTEDDVFDFIDEIVNLIQTGKHDSLLFFISSHGDADGVILSSDCDEISLHTLFAKFFGDQCSIMVNKPKLFFVDACRGNLRSKINIAKHGSNKNNGLVISEKVDAQREKESSSNNDCNKSIAVRGKKHENESSNDKTVPRTNNDNYNGSNNETRISSNRKSVLENLFHTEANCRFIYANPDGYAAIDGGKNGGYLIQSIKHVFMKKNDIENENLDSIVNQIRLKTRQLVGKGVMQNVQDVNHMNFHVYFKKCHS